MNIEFPGNQGKQEGDFGIPFWRLKATNIFTEKWLLQYLQKVNSKIFFINVMYIFTWKFYFYLELCPFIGIFFYIKFFGRNSASFKLHV